MKALVLLNLPKHKSGKLFCRVAERSSRSSLYYPQTLSAETQTTQCIYRQTTVWFITLPRSVEYFHECGQPSDHKRNHITVIAICYLFSYVVHKRTVCIKNGAGWRSFNLCAHRQIGSFKWVFNDQILLISWFLLLPLTYILKICIYIYIVYF